MPDLQGIPYSDPVRIYILAYEDSRFAVICGMATAAFDTLQAVPDWGVLANARQLPYNVPLIAVILRKGRI